MRGWGGTRGECCQLLLVVVVVDGDACQLLLLLDVVGSQGGGKEGGGRERGEVDTGMLCASPHLRKKSSLEISKVWFAHLPGRAGEIGPESVPQPFRFLCLQTHCQYLCFCMFY